MDEQYEREQRRLHWMWIQNQRRQHERRKQKFSAKFERERAEILRQEGERNRDSRSDDNRESRDEPSASHRRERNTSPMGKEKRLTFTVEAKESDPNRPTLNYENVVIERRAGEGSRPIFDRPEILVNRNQNHVSSSNFATHRRTSSERASSHAPAEEFRTIAVVNPATSSAASAPRRTDHRRPTASSPGHEPARFQSSSSSSSSFCRRFQDISLSNHRSRARSRSRSPRPNERDDHRRVDRRSRSSSASRHRRVDDASESSRSHHHSRSQSRSRTSQHNPGSDRRRSRSRERSHRRRSSRSRSRSPSRRGNREPASVYGPQMPYPFVMQPPGMFPMGPFPGGAVNPLPRFAYPTPPPPPPPRLPAPRFNPYYRAPYR